MRKHLQKQDIVVYHVGATLAVAPIDTVAQSQTAAAFDVDLRTVNEHIQNIYKTGELTEKPTLWHFRIVQKEGKREVAN